MLRLETDFNVVYDTLNNMYDEYWDVLERK